MSNSRAPIALKIDDRFYIDAWAIAHCVDGELTMQGGQVYDIPSARIGHGLTHLRQLTSNCPTIRTLTMIDGRTVDLVVESIEAIDFPVDAPWADVAFHGVCGEISLPVDVDREQPTGIRYPGVTATGQEQGRTWPTNKTSRNLGACCTRSCGRWPTWNATGASSPQSRSRMWRHSGRGSRWRSIKSSR